VVAGAAGAAALHEAALHEAAEPAAAAPAVAELLQAEAARSFPDSSPGQGFQWKPVGQISGGLVLPKSRHIPERSCVACGVKTAKSELVRVVKTREGPIIVDTEGRESGRGAYLCHTPDCWDRAIGKGALERSFKQSLSDQDLEPVRTHYLENFAPQAPEPNI